MRRMFVYLNNLFAVYKKSSTHNLYNKYRGTTYIWKEKISLKGLVSL